MSAPAMRRRALAFWTALFALSGACGLLYEMVWIRAFSLVLGSSSLALATVTAAFMAGLALGSVLAARVVDRAARPLALYALIELGIAVTGGTSLALLASLEPALGALHRAGAAEGAGAWPALARLALVAAIVLVPTALMGASLPALVAGIARANGGRLPPRALALLYCANTAGGAAGAVVGGMVLLPTLGLSRTLTATALASVAVAITAYAFARHAGRRAPMASAADPPDTTPPDAAAPPRHPRAILAALALGGMLAVALQVAGTRLLVPVLGASSLAFTAILATALLAIAAGSLTVAVLGQRAPAGPGGMAVLFLLAGVGAAATAMFGNSLPDLFRQLARAGLGSAADATGSGFGASSAEDSLLAAFVALAGLTLAVPLGALGAVLPLGTLALAGGTAGRAAGRACAANTVGAVAGALGTALWLLPTVGLEATLHALSIAMLCTGAVLAFLATPKGRTAAVLRRAAYAAPVLGAALVLGTDRARLDVAHLQWGVFRWILSERPLEHFSSELAFVRDGASSTVTVFRTPDVAFLKVNGKSDGASRPPDLVTQYHLAHLPLLFLSNPRRALVIGLGTGATVRGVTAHGLDRVDVVELEPAIREAARHFHVVNDGVPDDSSLVRVHLDDGRSFLTHSDGSYDLIISEPSNPWIAGTSALFTLEFYARARARLAPGGVFCQWIQAYELSRETLHAMILGLHESFGHVAIFLRNSDLVCVASTTPLRIDAERAQARLARPEVAMTLARIDEAGLADLLFGIQAVLPLELSRFQASWRNRDDTMLLEHRAPLEMYRGLSPNLVTRSLAEQLDLARGLVGYTATRCTLAAEMALALARHAPARADDIYSLAPTSLAAGEAGRIATLAYERLAARRRAHYAYDDAEQDVARGDYASAERRLSALAGDPAVERDARLRTERALGQVRVRLERYEAARDAFARALDLYPDDYASRTWLGVLLARSGDLARAEPELTRALVAAPRYAPAQAGRIAVLGALGRGDEARTAARAVLKPGELAGVEQLARALVDEGFVPDGANPR